MTEIWEAAFDDHELMWGTEPARSARLAAEWLAPRGVTELLIPGIGYGRNALPFLEQGMSVTGIEISATAIALARERLGLSLQIHHGSVTQMPFDERRFDGVFCHGLIYLLSPLEREKLLRDCLTQLIPGGHMAFSLITTSAPMYGTGTKLGEAWYEVRPGMPMFFYDEASARREFGPHGLVELVEVDEPTPGGGSFPFLLALCHPPAEREPRGEIRSAKA